jgi:hypothetical protein
MKKVILLVSSVTFVLLYSLTVLTFWEALSISLFVHFFLELLEKLGKRIAILDLSIIMAIFTWLVMPVIFYYQYTYDNRLARLWVKYMPISSEDYFSFAVPATLMLILGYRFPLRKLAIYKNPAQYMENVRERLATSPTLGISLITIGITSGLLDTFVPGPLRQIFYLFDHLTYVGVFYVIYSPNRLKRVLVPFVIALAIGQSIVTGMFGELIFILALSLVLVMLGKKMAFRRKLLFAIGGIFLIILIQSVKREYRQRNWLEGAGADPMYFAELVTERISSPSSIIDPNMLFFTAIRMNQGWLVATTMKRVPSRYPFAYGETIWQSVAASFVPRILWPDKPESGGKANLKRFWGYNLVGFSMNIGPVGEGYANFGRTGGIIYMFFYGLFFNFMLSYILKMAAKTPTLILWIPFLFLYSVSVETDLLTTMNSLIKGTVFIYLMYQFFKLVLRKPL